MTFRVIFRFLFKVIGSDIFHDLRPDLCEYQLTVHAVNQERLVHREIKQVCM